MSVRTWPHIGLWALAFLSWSGCREDRPILTPAEVKVIYLIPYGQEGGYSFTYDADSTRAASKADAAGYYRLAMTERRGRLNVPAPEFLPLTRDSVTWVDDGGQPVAGARFVHRGVCARDGQVHFLVERDTNSSERTQALLSDFYRNFCDGAALVDTADPPGHYLPLGPIVEYRTEGAVRYWRDRSARE